ncbi:AAA family ATPase, partial [Yersinia pestis]|uniref:nucleotide-binding protein n=1 Tax=Yersinia pestis TaxID=632 RepID=UPI001C4645C2
SIQQINDMRAVFKTRLSKPKGENPVVLAIAAHKVGAYKTSTSVHIAQWMALLGLRVLLIDETDPQATAYLYHGFVPDLHIHEE